MAVLLSNLLEKSSNFRQLLKNFGATFWKFWSNLFLRLSVIDSSICKRKTTTTTQQNKTKQNKNIPGSKPLPPCTETNSIFHDVFKFKKASKLKKDFDQYC